MAYLAQAKAPPERGYRKFETGNGKQRRNRPIFKTENHFYSMQRQHQQPEEEQRYLDCLSDETKLRPTMTQPLAQESGEPAAWQTPRDVVTLPSSSWPLRSPSQVGERTPSPRAARAHWRLEETTRVWLRLRPTDRPTDMTSLDGREAHTRTDTNRQIARQAGGGKRTPENTQFVGESLIIAL